MKLRLLVVSALLAIPVAAASSDGKIGSVLAEGYEIKAAYISEGKTKYVLQKGSSVSKAKCRRSKCPRLFVL